MVEAQANGGGVSNQILTGFALCGVQSSQHMVRAVLEWAKLARSASISRDEGVRGAYWLLRWATRDKVILGKL